MIDARRQHIIIYNPRFVHFSLFEPWPSFVKNIIHFPSCKALSNLQVGFPFFQPLKKYWDELKSLTFQLLISNGFFFFKNLYEFMNFKIYIYITIYICLIHKIIYICFLITKLLWNTFSFFTHFFITEEDSNFLIISLISLLFS